MGILRKVSGGHWQYFLALEQDLKALSRYVDFSQGNMATYSLEMARILLAAASEADVLLKDICKRENPVRNARGIGGYFDVVTDTLPAICRFEVELPWWGLSFIPWEQWSRNDPPGWWTSYNKVKHHRSTHFERANLQHTIESVGAVYVLNVYHDIDAAKEGKLRPIPTIFRPGPANHNGPVLEGLDYGISYKL